MTTFAEAQEFLPQHRTDDDVAVDGFKGLDPVPFIWAIRRVQLRGIECSNGRNDALRGVAFCEDDFPELQELRSKVGET